MNEAGNVRNALGAPAHPSRLLQLPENARLRDTGSSFTLYCCIPQSVNRFAPPWAYCQYCQYCLSRSQKG